MRSPRRQWILQDPFVSQIIDFCIFDKVIEKCIQESIEANQELNPSSHVLANDAQNKSLKRMQQRHVYTSEVNLRLPFGKDSMFPSFASTMLWSSYIFEAKFWPYEDPI